MKANDKVWVVIECGDGESYQMVEGILAYFNEHHETVIIEDENGDDFPIQKNRVFETYCDANEYCTGLNKSSLYLSALTKLNKLKTNTDNKTVFDILAHLTPTSLNNKIIVKGSNLKSIEIKDNMIMLS